MSKKEPGYIPINEKYRFSKNPHYGWDIQKLGKMKGEENWVSINHGMKFNRAANVAIDMLLTDETFTSLVEAEAAIERCCQRLSRAVGARITIEG